MITWMIYKGRTKTQDVFKQGEKGDEGKRGIRRTKTQDVFKFSR